ncbi:MAG: zinc ribbon domain-containing protein [Blastocatellia bacterium]|nr:zinc ribbon domain-containing protein [Blastocatellia bacterium]
MITCPRCGAENKPTATMCRMCATPLEAPATLMTPAFDNAPPGGGNVGPGEVLCSICGAVNDSTWAFCQQCGSPLHRAPAPPAAPPKPAPPPSPPMAPPMPPPMAQPMAPPTVIAQPMVAPPTVIAQPMVAPPTVIAQPMVAPPTVIAQPVPQPQGFSTPQGATPAMGAVSCTNCGKQNPGGSSFCAACGAALPAPAESTVVMSSQPRGPVARLRLIQEGGGEGEVYKLETDEVIVGRNAGDIRFPHDGYMSGRHARIVRKGDQFVLHDENSRNGTFKKIDGEVKLKPGDVILIGKQLFRFEVQ